jgi:hypothetical protein
LVEEEDEELLQQGDGVIEEEAVVEFEEAEVTQGAEAEEEEVHPLLDEGNGFMEANFKKKPKI